VEQFTFAHEGAVECLNRLGSFPVRASAEVRAEPGSTGSLSHWRSAYSGGLPHLSGVLSIKPPAR